MRPDHYTLPIVLLLFLFMFNPTRSHADDICKADFKNYNLCQITQQSGDNIYNMSCAEMQSVVMRAFDNTTSPDGVEVSEAFVIHGTKTIWNCKGETRKVHVEYGSIAFLFDSGTCTSSNKINNQSLPTLSISNDPEATVNPMITD